MRPRQKRGVVLPWAGSPPYSHERMFASVPDAGIESLNEAQRRAANHAAGPLLILAGAGTGKTTTLCARVAVLVEQGVAPERILLLTFTRRAAREMLARARALGRNTTRSRFVVGGTFHSVAYRTILREAPALGLEGVRLFDASDAADLLDLLREELGLASTERRFPRKGTLLDIYSRTVNAQQELSRVLNESFPWCADFGEEIARLFRAYSARKRDLNALDLDDLLLYWQAAVSNERLGGRLAGQYEHVLVDEYQDVNTLQVEIVRALCLEHDNLTVVGDDMQAIYGFRAADPAHILDFTSLYPQATVVKLERNYRSPQALLDAGNEVALHAPRSFARRLTAERQGDARPELVFCFDDRRQAIEVCERVLARREQGSLLREQAVLLRAGHHSDLLELELSRRKVPFVKYGGIRYLEAAHVKDFVALLRVATNPTDQLGWFRLLQLLEGVGPMMARRLFDDLLSEPHPLSDLPRRWRDMEVPVAARESGLLLLEALAAAANATVSVQAERLKNALAPLIRAAYPDGETRLVDLEQLAGAAAAAKSLERFVAELVLDPPLSSADYAGPPGLDEDYLVLSTIHSAKGLEWEHVHLIHASDGNIPADMALSTKEGLEEERRLFYVALTRPRRSLSLYVPLRYYHRPRGRDDAHGYGKASRFLTERLQALCDVVRAEEVDAETLPAAAAAADSRIEVSLDHLF
jgi:DNA helicase II / ATP-dependent DNA helicase PcrA